MSGFFQFAHRVWQIASPPTGPPKNPDALKFGILGAAKIAPNALINPASQHPDVIIQAIAARDKTKATAYAKKHNIPQVFDTYNDLLSDPSITCIFIPLPNALHYEWALKALSQGKHVLLEKPSTSNATEASLLFRSPLLTSTPSLAPPIILEAFHYKFHPAWHLFTSLLERESGILHAKVNMFIPGMLFSPDDIRFKYDLSGGALMDAAYTSSVLLNIFASEPEECLSCEVQTRPKPNELCDESFGASFRFPGDGVGEIHGTLAGGVMEMLKDRFSVEVLHRGVIVDDGSDQETIRTRRVVMMNFIMPVIWHRIDVEDTFVVRKKTDSGDGTGDVIRTWKTRESRKAYTFKEAGIEGGDSKAWWTTYRYQLDAFVDRVKGREVPSGAWVDGEDSIKTMRMVDMAYEKSGLPIRPTSKFRLASS